MGVERMSYFCFKQSIVVGTLRKCYCRFFLHFVPVELPTIKSCRKFIKSLYVTI